VRAEGRQGGRTLRYSEGSNWYDVKGEEREKRVLFVPAKNQPPGRKRRNKSDQTGLLLFSRIEQCTSEK
jgi:hypothetical protein